MTGFLRKNYVQKGIIILISSLFSFLVSQWTMDTPHLDLNILANHPVQSVDLDYRGIRIKVHKNGDQYDRGTAVVICRKRFRHWLTFLDFLTKKLNLTAPVHEFYRTDGLRIQHVRFV